MASDRVARWLLERSRITRGQLDEAVRAQGFFGGEVESHLVKLGHVVEADLGAALTEIYGVPFASAEHLRTLPQSALDAVPLAIIERTRACPFHREGNRLRVAMLNPRDRLAATEIEQSSGLKVEPWVTTEYRLYSALERHWRIRIEGVRAISPAAPVPNPVPSDLGRSKGDRSPHAPAEPTMGLDGRPLDAEADADALLTPQDWTASPAARDWLGDEAEVGGPDPVVGPEAPHPVETRAAERAERTLETMGVALADALTREEATDALLGFCSAHAERVALFAVGKDGVRGVAARGSGLDDASVRRITVSAGSGTVFDAALGGGEFYFGVVPPLPPNRDLYTAMGGLLPRQVMIFPVSVKGRVAALLYLDGGSSLFERPDLPTMRRAATMAGLAFEALLIRAKLREV